MKIFNCSDLHSEFYENLADFQKVVDSFPEADVLCVTGDILSTGFKTVDTQKETPFFTGDFSKLDRHFEVFEMFSKKYPHVIYTPGNHEYYGCTIEQGTQRLQEIVARFPNVHLLDNSVVEIEGQRFVGGTMWYANEKDTWIWKQRFADFRFIQNLSNHFEKMNQAFKDLIETVVPTDIVISHHLPSPLSTPHQYKLSPENIFFVHDMTAKIEEKQPKLWLHGHTHEAMDYCIDNTRVICNPKGYPGEFSWQNGYEELEEPANGFNHNTIEVIPDTDMVFVTEGRVNS